MRPAYEDFIDTFEIPLLYAFIGAENFASIEEVKKAYKQTVRKYHPDLNPENKDDLSIKMANASYAILSDPDKKAEFDEFFRNEFWSRFGWIRGKGERPQKGAQTNPPPRSEEKNYKEEAPHEDHTWDKSGYDYHDRWQEQYASEPDVEEEDPPCHPGGAVVFEFIDSCMFFLKKHSRRGALATALLLITVIGVPKAVFYLTTTPAERAAIVNTEEIKKAISEKNIKIERMERELRLKRALQQPNSPTRGN